MKFIFILPVLLFCAMQPALANDLPGTKGQDIGANVKKYKQSGPIEVKSGQTISGLWITNPAGPCLHAHNVSNVRITNNKIGPCGKTNLGVGIDAYNITKFKVDHNSFFDVAGGLSAVDSPKGNITFSNNYAQRVRGPGPRGQMVQFDKVQGPSNRITCNVSDQVIGGYGPSGPEDHINLYKSGGTSSSPIEVAYNKVRGGGTSTGGGIMTGDYGGAYETVHDNIVVNAGQYGIGVAGGHDIKILNNKIYVDKQTWTNIGMYAWGQGGIACSAIEMRGNHVYYIGREGTLSPYWNGSNCGNGATITHPENYNSFNDPKIKASIWDTVIKECK